MNIYLTLNEFKYKIKLSIGREKICYQWDFEIKQRIDLMINCFIRKKARLGQEPVSIFSDTRTRSRI